MSEKKHIDRLFQEGFKDFEATPSDAVWKNIEASLNEKKKKRRVIPIWWRYAGVAALLLLLFTVGYTFFNDNSKTPTNQVVETDNDASLEQLNEETNSSLKNSDNTTDIKTAVIDNEESKEGLNTSNEKTSLEKSQNKLNSINESSIVESSKSTRKSNNSVNNVSKDNIKNKLVNPASNNAIADLSEKEEKGNALVTSSNDENNTSNESLIDKEKARELLNKLSDNSNNIAQNKDEQSESATENETEKNALSIEEALDKNKDLSEEEELKQNRWSIAPNAAPVYFNSLGEGSSIDPQFNKNAKSGEVNMSYGISASYAINNKLSVRSGINKVNLGYNTNDVIIFQSAGLNSSSGALQNVNSTGNNSSSDAVSVISAESLNNNTIPEDFATTNTSLNQALGYIEIPLEIQYTLSDKKLGVNVIGGFSSFFLNDNEIYSEAENGNRTFLGEANNINKVSYSANFGLGFNYQVSKKIDLNLEPMFKYQINTFKNTSGNFTPFFIGVYTGFAIKF
ncbi:hypothetical protein L3X39_03290 [Sabulilitoribacter multivorans]|uniref:Outer membrane protein beta-barrel domain-containing protein n=1 Tax=Flaviramulus multivorans TaxID=1304750 RepID=A0ABS9IFX5_9FLAO|nr:hypothetical protein [Flaviramulus multivorans]MCF7559648.1 hypothetical protein [Flaviramulus multivorans]